MNKVLEYFKKNNEKVLEKDIHVYGWKNEYDYHTPKTRHRVALSRAELKYHKFLRNKEN